MSTIYNPSLRQTKRSDLAPILPMRKNSSVLDWLEGTGRLLDRETVKKEVSSTITPEEDEEEISALMGADDTYDDDDDDDSDMDD